jgi:hypothetical protein
VKQHGCYRNWIAVFCLILSQTLLPRLTAITLEQLQQDAQLTPQRFVSYFSKFRFEARDAVQKPEIFLANQAGDCDDFATLAATIFKDKGFHTKLVVVRMPEEVHMVCCVVEAGCYLDFNNRNCFSRTVATSGSVEDIAKKVSRSFGSRWLSAAEYDGGSSVGQVGRMVVAKGAEANVGVRTERSMAAARPAPTPAMAPERAQSIGNYQIAANN